MGITGLSPSGTYQHASTRGQVGSMGCEAEDSHGTLVPRSMRQGDTAGQEAGKKRSPSLQTRHTGAPSDPQHKIPGSTGSG